MNRGFTLIELMVSVAIFSVVMVIGLGSLLSIVSADRKANAAASVMNNMNFALESMGRNIRTGYNYHCSSSTGGDCTGSPGTYFAFTAVDGSFVEYRYQTSGGCDTGCIARQITRAGVPSGYIRITSPDISIGTLNFYLTGFCTRSGTTGSANTTLCTADTKQPRLTILLRGTGQVNNATTTFNIQTSVTQRLYDL